MSIRLNPPAASGSGFDKDRHEGDPLLFLGVEKREGTTQYGDATWAFCGYAINLNTGEIARDAAVFGKMAAPSIYGAGPVVIGRLVRGTASRAGQSQPWLLEDLTPSEVEKAQRFVDRYVTELPSGRFLVDEVAFRRDRELP